MENEAITSVDYGSAAIQLIFFFGLMSIIVLPAFLFRNLADKYNKSRWGYFAVGLLVGIVILNLSRLIMLGFTYIIPTGVLGDYVSIILYISGFLLVWLSVRLLKYILPLSGLSLRLKPNDYLACPTRVRL